MSICQGCRRALDSGVARIVWNSLSAALHRDSSLWPNKFKLTSKRLMMNISAILAPFTNVLAFTYLLGDDSTAKKNDNFNWF